MTDVTAFLRARIAEDEDRSSLVLVAEVDMSSGIPEVRHRAIRDRVLAECTAKREILEVHAEQAASDGRGCENCNELNEIHHELDSSGWPCSTLRAVLQVYADHPDFDPTWRS